MYLKPRSPTLRVRKPSTNVRAVIFAHEQLHGVEVTGTPITIHNPISYMERMIYVRPPAASDFGNCAGNFSGTKKTEEMMVARGSMLELLRIDPDTDKLVSLSASLICSNGARMRSHHACWNIKPGIAENAFTLKRQFFGENTPTRDLILRGGIMGKIVLVHMTALNSLVRFQIKGRRAMM